MKIEHALQEYLIEIQIRKYSPKTIRSYRNNLNLFLRYLNEEAEITMVEEIALTVVKKSSLYIINRGKRGTYINGLLKTINSFMLEIFLLIYLHYTICTIELSALNLVGLFLTGVRPAKMTRKTILAQFVDYLV